MTDDSHPPAVAFVLAVANGGAMIVNRLDQHSPDNGAGVGASLMYEGHYELGEIDLLSDIAVELSRTRGNGVMIVDGGANIGTHTILLARRLEGIATIVALEPQERVFYALAGNIALNNAFNARAIWAALAAKTGFMRIPQLNHRAYANFGGLSLKEEIAQEPGQPVDFSDKATIAVATMAIDDIPLKRLDILKLDLEGMEPEALAGAKITIKRLKPIVFAEWKTCGKEAIAAALPDYEHIHAGMNLLCIPKGDPIRAKLTGADLLPQKMTQ